MFQAVSKLLLMSTLLVCSSVLADQLAPFWVLGSYSKADNAHREQARLSSTLGVPVEVRFDQTLGVFRVLAKTDLVNREQLGEMPAWRINLNTDEAAADGTASDQNDVPASASNAPAPGEPPDPATSSELVALPSDATLPTVEEPEAVVIMSERAPLFPALQQNESLTEYCLRLPNEQLCQHPRIERVLEADRKLMDHRRFMVNICQKISDPGHRKTCEQLH